LKSMIVIAFALLASLPQDHPVGYDDTPLLPGSTWRVHDSKRPPPPVVAPGTTPGAAPADAIVLFDGKDLSRWRTAKDEPAAWRVENGYAEVGGGKGDIETRDEFGDCQLHLEFALPSPPKSESQGRGNSGVFFLGRYELQVLDSHENRTYADGQCAALYGQKPPLVNASRAPGEWQSYDVVFRGPRFADGKLARPASITAFHNGVLVQDHQALLGATAHRAVAAYAPHPPKGPLKLQDHGDPVRYRNVWIRPLADE
jgi:hypothetical protein